MRITHTISLALLAGAAMIGSLQPAMALDPQAFVDRIAAVYAPLGYTLEFGDAKLKDDTIVVSSARIGLTGMGEPLDVKTEVTFHGVTELPDGGYMADTVTVPDIESDINEADVPGHISLKDIVMEHFYLPGGETIGAQAMVQLVGSIATGPLSVTRKGAEVIAFDSIKSINTFNPAQGSAALVDVASTFAVNGIAVDLSSVKEEDAQAGAVIDGLGLTNITGNITGSLGWSMADGRMSVDQMLMDFDNLGALDLTFDISGFTPAVMDQMYAAQAKMMAEGTDPTSEEAQAAQMMMGMQVAQAISLISASVRYDDASLAGRLLDFFAQAQGVERPQFVEGLKAMLTQTLAGSGVPALADLVGAPVSSFLDDPQSLEVAVAPPSPTSLLVLTAAAANPAGLISALGLTVTANQAAE